MQSYNCSMFRKSYTPPAAQITDKGASTGLWKILAWQAFFSSGMYGYSILYIGGMKGQVNVTEWRTYLFLITTEAAESR
jgi:hypothetical protein